jgi:tetratricopeptide (TPR) repeat protein
MGDVYRHQQHFRVAEMYYQKACDLDTSDAALINAVGLALWQMDRRDQARACFDRAHELKPDVVAYRLNRARYSPWQISRWFDVFSK